MKYIPLVLLLAISLQGCDAANDAAKELGAQAAKIVSRSEPVTLVFHSGYEMVVDGRAVPIFGKDECPPSNSEFWKAIFGPDRDEGKRACIVIAPDTTNVSVTVGLPDGPADEIWTVERSGDRTMLRRADGSYLGAAKSVAGSVR